MRAYLGPGFRDADLSLDDQGVLRWTFDETAGLERFRQAVAWVERHHGSRGGLIQGMLYAGTVDTCTPETLRRVPQTAARMGVGHAIHSAQNLVEFHAVLARYGKTPVALLRDTNFLGPRSLLAHCLFLSGDPRTRYPGNDDLEALAQSGASVAHCPLVFGRRGLYLYSFTRYRRAGVNLGVGTDTYPRDIIGELRHACYACKIVEGDVHTGTAREVFDAATLGGARALERDDLGRLAPGAKADIVVVSLDSLRVGPYHDPVRALVECCNGDDVEAVWINGRQVVAGGRVIGLDEWALVRAARAQATALGARLSEWDWRGRTLEAAFPLAIPEAEPGEFT